MGIGTITGAAGRIEWGYFVAATVERYTVARTGKAWSLTARVVTRNAYNLAQSPLVFVAPTKYFEWRWRIESFTLSDGGTLAAVLSAPIQGGAHAITVRSA